MEKLRRRTDPEGFKSPLLRNEPILYGVRHGTTSANVKDEFRGWGEFELEDEGINEAHEVAEWFLEHGIKPKRIVCSPLSRAKRTAEIIGMALGVEVEVEERFKPLNVGEFTGEDKEAVWDDFVYYLDHPKEVIPGGESVRRCAERVCAALDELLDEAVMDGPIILVAHTSDIVIADCYLRTGEIGMDCRPEEKDIVDPGGVVAISGDRSIVPVFKDVKEKEEEEDPDKAEHEEYDTEKTSAWTAGGVPTLSELAKHIRGEITPWFSSKERLRDAFYGKCDTVAIWLADMVGGRKVRGWYTGHISADMDNTMNKAKHHAHSWVEKDGKIYDPTWWAFTDAKPRIYVFPIGDPRYVEDEDAESGVEPKKPYSGYVMQES